MYKIDQEKGVYYIYKRCRIPFMPKWIKVPDAGLGWGIKNMAFIEGSKYKDVLEKILNIYYLKDE